MSSFGGRSPARGLQRGLLWRFKVLALMQAAKVSLCLQKFRAWGVTTHGSLPRGKAMAHASPPNSPRSRAGVLSGRQEPHFGRASSRAGALSRAPQGAGLRAGRRGPRLRTGQRRPPRPLPAGGFSGQRLPGPALTDRPTSWAAPIMGSGGARGPTMRKGLSLSGAALLLLLLPAATAQQSPGAGEDRGGRSGPEEAGEGGRGGRGGARRGTGRRVARSSLRGVAAPARPGPRSAGRPAGLPGCPSRGPAAAGAPGGPGRPFVLAWPLRPRSAAVGGGPGPRAPRGGPGLAHCPRWALSAILDPLEDSSPA